MALNISTDQKPLKNLSKLASGYLKLIGKRKLYLSPYESTTLKIKGTMGLNEEFKNAVGIVVNDGEEFTVNVNGHGIMPMLSNCKPKLKFSYQATSEIVEEYYILQKIYYFEIFKPITEKEFDHIRAGGEEDTESFNIDAYRSLLTDRESITSKSTIETPKDIHFYMLVRTYVMIENNENLPNPTILYQQLQTEKFLNRLRSNKELSSYLNLIHRNYLLHQKSYGAQMPTNLKHFTIQPLPFHLTPLILDMGKLYFNQCRKLVLQLEFLGPGRLMAACRSAIKIPGLNVNFGITGKYEINIPPLLDFHTYSIFIYIYIFLFYCLILARVISRSFFTVT